MPETLVAPALSRESAAALHAIAVAYAADEDHADHPFIGRLDRAIEPLRDVLTHEEAVEAGEELRDLWA